MRRLACLAALLAAVAAATAAGTAEGAASTGPRVVLVLESGGCPATFTLRICQGFERAIQLTGVSGRIVAPTARETLTDFYELLARQGNATIVTFGFPLVDALGTVSTRHPRVPFVVVDRSWTSVPGRPRNVHGVVFRTSEAAYLAGWLAGKLERRRPGQDVVGVVGGVKIPSVVDFVLGFASGARRAAPGVRVLVDYSDNFVDGFKCAAIARRQIARGAGTLFNVAGACGLGTLEAAKEAGVWGVGVDSDQSFLGPHILTSVLKHYGAGFLDVLRQVKAGRIATGRDTVLTMRDGAVGLGRISPEVPRSLVTQLEKVRRRIVSGEVVVPGAFARPSAG